MFTVFLWLVGISVVMGLVVMAAAIWAPGNRYVVKAVDSLLHLIDVVCVTCGRVKDWVLRRSKR